MIIDDSGNVGIGTTSPNYPLEIAGTTQIRNTGPVFSMYETDGAAANRNWDIFALAETLKFRAVADDFSSASDYMNIDRTGTVIDSVTFPNGNVGIGTTNPNSKLDIRSYGGTSTSSQMLYSTGTGLNYLDIQSDNTTDSAGSIIRLITTDAADTAATTVNLVKYNNGGFFINNNETDAAAHTSFGVGGSTRMRISSSGNVGIGTTNPVTKLAVNGDVQIGNSSATCDATTEGSQRYNSSSKKMEFCNGTTWGEIGGGSSSSSCRVCVQCSGATEQCSSYSSGDVKQDTALSGTSGLGSCSNVKVSIQCQ
jgi:hypothetical protein